MVECGKRKSGSCNNVCDTRHNSGDGRWVKVLIQITINQFSKHYNNNNNIVLYRLLALLVSTSLVNNKWFNALCMFESRFILYFISYYYSFNYFTLFLQHISTKNCIRKLRRKDVQYKLSIFNDYSELRVELLLTMIKTNTFYRYRFARSH